MAVPPKAYTCLDQASCHSMLQVLRAGYSIRPIPRFAHGPFLRASPPQSLTLPSPSLPKLWHQGSPEEEPTFPSKTFLEAHGSRFAQTWVALPGRASTFPNGAALTSPGC